MNNTAPLTSTRSVRRDARRVCANPNISAIKTAARRHERRTRRHHDHIGDFDWTPSRRGLTGWEIS